MNQSPCFLELVVQEGGKASAQINRMHEGHDKYYQTCSKMLLWGLRKGENGHKWGSIKAEHMKVIHLSDLGRAMSFVAQYTSLPYMATCLWEMTNKH